MENQIAWEVCGTLDCAWIFWRAIVPIAGPGLISAIVIFAFMYVTETDRPKITDLPFHRTLEPGPWLYFSVTVFAFSVFEIGTLDGLSIGAMVGLVLVLIFHAAFLHQKHQNEGKEYTPPNLLKIIALFGAVASAFVGYLATNF